MNFEAPDIVLRKIFVKMNFEVIKHKKYFVTFTNSVFYSNLIG